MRILIIITLLLFTLPVAYGQKVDTVINTGIYKSYFCYGMKVPLYVTYPLHKGGGECDRQKEGFNFKQDGIPITAKTDDYRHSKYEKGHLANAEDFAYDCILEEITFRFYNCFPQTPTLNKGTWKTWETAVRKLSQNKKLFIVAGAVFNKRKTKFIGSGVAIPDYCYKIVLDAKTKKILHCIIFRNDNSKKFANITLARLKKRLTYPLVPK